ncbi:MAG: ABC transporter permease [Chloroflexi bacterium]|nr:ABC transporter permease [Chloroflexota bacterium]
MTQYLIRRTVQALFAVLVLLTVVFFVTHVSGDPVLLMLPLESSVEQYQAVRRAMGFDAPLHIQFVRFMSAALQGDFGKSLWQDVPALPLVLERLPATLLLAASVVALSLAIAVPLAILAVARPRGPLDRLISVTSLGGASVPEFWLALILVIVFAAGLRLLPTSGYGGWQFLVLPMAALLPRRIGRIAQVLRVNLLDEIGKQYTTTAHAKGLSANRVLFQHVLRNAAIPALTVAGDEIATLVNGAIIVEIVFAWPGIGYQAFTAIQHRDLPVIEATVFVVAALVLVVNLAVDLSYAVIDPRIRYR